MGDGTETRRHAAKGDQGLDTHSRAADLDSGAEYVVDEQVGVVQRGDPHAGDAEAQQTQLPEDTATDKEIKTEEASVTDKEVKTEETGATEKEIRTEEAGGKQGGVKDGGNLDAKDADGQVAKLPEFRRKARLMRLVMNKSVSRKVAISMPKTSKKRSTG
ncbi:hypothetical protein PF005_g23795 [Phytophthora fragariae]|uniref:Uncharacterized protein n=1 Tax=Phytophthora fragariae TaxID=53985 RepID=A0A6A3WG11_9STRA|nr:hypothetical protein PF005_g23795 [Phytophthora fragariae]